MHMYKQAYIPHLCTRILQDPTSQVVLPNDEATFTCTMQTAGDYYLYINGNPTLPGDVPGVTISISDLPNDVHTVTIVIVAYLWYNTTTVQCVLDGYSADSFMYSSVAYLCIAGKRYFLYMYIHT